MAQPVPWMRAYRREWVLPDLLATLTLLAIAVPEQLAISRLAVGAPRRCRSAPPRPWPP